MLGCRVRLWRFGRGRLRPVVGTEDVMAPPVRVEADGRIVPIDESRHVAPVPDLDGYWYELSDVSGDVAAIRRNLTPILARLLDSERDTLRLAKQLAARYEETELLYTISEVLGRTVRLEEAAETILSEVTDVVGARRASLFVFDADAGALRPIAGIGRNVSELGTIALGDPDSITARVFRTGQPVVHDPRAGAGTDRGVSEERHYRGRAYLSYPVSYPEAGGAPRSIGVLNLTDRIGSDAFSGGERRLVAAVASQIGVAIENARLVERDLTRQRVSRELELAHGLQLKLLPSPAVLGPDVDVAARCIPAASVGGDFYYFSRLPAGRIGVMLGDVSSHGFSAALVAAVVLSAAGIFAEEAAAPDVTLRRLLEAVRDDLTETEMHLTLFYGVLDPQAHHIRYANAGHPHAFRLPAAGTPQRLAATSPPLGLTEADAIAAADAPWDAAGDRLLLFSDGLVDAAGADGVRFGEDRILALASEEGLTTSLAIVAAIVAAVAQFEPVQRDDRTIVALRA